MSKPTLYLMLGYPGSGKTTTAKIIHDQTAAVHLWADKIRRERFGTPTYSRQENHELYEHLNELTAELLATGQSVIFDTNFNFYKDRSRLASIAAEHGAKAIVVWVKTPKPVAKDRATQNAHVQNTRVLGNMPGHHFERISNNLQPPRTDEIVVEIDGTKVTTEYVQERLRQVAL